LINFAKLESLFQVDWPLFRPAAGLTRETGQQIPNPAMPEMKIEDRRFMVLLAQRRRLRRVSLCLFNLAMT
jgi:hypothetical protein